MVDRKRVVLGQRLNHLARKRRKGSTPAVDPGPGTAPTDINLSNLTFNDADSALNYTIGTLSAVDAEGGSITYTLTADTSGFFKITGNQLKCNTGGISPATYTVEVTATDNKGNTYAESFDLVCVHYNRAPTTVSLSGASFNDYDASGTTVGTVSYVDPDGDTCTLTLTDNAGGKFALVGNAIKLNASNIAIGTYTIEVTCTDPSELTKVQSFTLTSVHNNRAPNSISLSNASFADNVVLHTTVGTLSGVDPDSDTLTFSVISDASNNFEVSGGTTLRTKNANIAAGTYSVTVRAVDPSNASFDQAFTLTSTHTGVAPTDISLTSATFNDDVASGATIGTFSVTDANPGDTSTLALSGTDAALFTIVGNVLKTASANIAAGAKSIRVTATDSDALTFFKDFTITSQHHNDNPTDLSVSNLSFDSASGADFEIGTITTTDPDSGDTFTYSLTTNPSSYFKIVGDKLKSNATVPIGTYGIGINVVDQLGGTYSESFTVTVTDAPATPTDIALTATTFTNTVASNTSIGTFSTTDANAGDTFTYSLQVNPSSYFNISGNALRTNQASIPEGTYSITVRTTDSTSRTFDKVFSITALRAYQTETTALVAQFTTAPSTTLKNQMDDLISSLKTHNVWTTLDLLYMCCVPAADQALINWVNPGVYTLTSSGSVTFTANQGWAGSATAGNKLNTGFNPLNAVGRKNSTSSAGIGAYVKTNSTTATRAFGEPGFGVTARTSTKGSLEIQSTTGIAYTGANTSYQGFFQGRRVDSGNAAAWLNLGASGFATANAATTLATNTMDLAGGGGNSSTSGSVHQVRAAYCGGGHNDTDVTNLYTDILAFITAQSANLSTGL
jgi:hypothetical protein